MATAVQLAVAPPSYSPGPAHVPSSESRARSDGDSGGSGPTDSVTSQTLPDLLLLDTILLVCPVSTAARLSRSLRMALLVHDARPLTLTINAESIERMASVDASLAWLGGRQGPLRLTFIAEGMMPVPGVPWECQVRGFATSRAGMRAAVHVARALATAAPPRPVTAVRVGFPNALRLGDLSHLSRFPRLARLELWQNTCITDLDLGFLPGLQTLMLSGCEALRSLDVSTNTCLRVLECVGAQLAHLDVSRNTQLTALDVSYNALVALDVSLNPRLTRLSVGNNQLALLDVSRLPLLAELDCRGNRLTAVDVSRNPLLHSLRCSHNQLGAQLDLWLNPELRTLEAGSCGLVELDVGSNPRLVALTCSNNALRTLRLAGAPRLRKLVASYNPLGGLDVSDNPALQTLHVCSCGLQALDLQRNPKLQILDASENLLTELDLSASTGLQILDCRFNRLAGLQLPADTGLQHLQYDRGVPVRRPRPAAAAPAAAAG